MTLNELKNKISCICPFLVESEKWAIDYKIPNTTTRLIHIDTQNKCIYIPNSVCIVDDELHIAHDGEAVYRWECILKFNYSLNVYDTLIISALNRLTLAIKKFKLNKKIEAIERDFAS